MFILTRQVRKNLIGVELGGGRKMKSLIVLVVLLMGFTALASPQVSYAQAVTGTMDDCIDSFYNQLAIWHSETADANRSVVCGVSAGKARVALAGKTRVALSGEESDTRFTRVVESRLIRSGKNKFCDFVIYREEQSPNSTDMGRFNLRGRDASAWNRFLKGPGCQDAIVLAP
jgi:hypothetical protein